jgi:hypothetical protein
MSVNTFFDRMKKMTLDSVVGYILIKKSFASIVSRGNFLFKKQDVPYNTFGHL